MVENGEKVSSRGFKQVASIRFNFFVATECALYMQTLNCDRSPTTGGGSCCKMEGYYISKMIYIFFKLVHDAAASLGESKRQVAKENKRETLF